MAIQRYKVALNPARFPLISTKGSRAVFTPGLDSAPRTPRTFMGAEPSADYNMTQVVYAENVMPVSEGYVSVAYSQDIAPTINTDFNAMFPLRDTDENIILYSPAQGKNYLYDTVAGAWTTDTIGSIFGLTVDTATGNTPENAKVSYAYVDGNTFICYSRLQSTTAVDMSIMKWNPVTQALEAANPVVTNLPFAVGTIDGISASSGFLIVWSGIEIAWAPFNGAAFDFTNYVNGDYTGAGSQIPEDIKGDIRAIIGISGGFLAFTNKNCIAGNYHAQNIVAPWLFREVSGAGGIDSFEQATVEGSLGVVYAYTTAGFQKVTLNSTDTIHPQVADFITGRQYESFDLSAKSLTTHNTVQDLAVKVTNIGNRYITISYGTARNVYQYVLVYDLHLERWGKLKFDHVDCFYYSYTPAAAAMTYAMAAAITYTDLETTPYSDLTAPATADLVAAPHALGLMTAAGAIHIATWDTAPRDSADEGVLVIGRVQILRARNTQLNRLEIEGFKAGTVSISPSYDGRRLTLATELTDIIRDDDFYVGGTQIDCKNFNINLVGTFDLSTLIVESMPSGQF